MCTYKCLSANVKMATTAQWAYAVNSFVVCMQYQRVRNSHALPLVLKPNTRSADHVTLYNLSSRINCKWNANKVMYFENRKVNDENLMTAGKQPKFEKGKSRKHEPMCTLWRLHSLFALSSDDAGYFRRYHIFGKWSRTDFVIVQYNKSPCDCRLALASLKVSSTADQHQFLCTCSAKQALAGRKHQLSLCKHGGRHGRDLVRNCGFEAVEGGSLVTA
jgi:hypothetical protein